MDLKAAQSRKRIICLVIQDQEFDINVIRSSSERSRSTKFQRCLVRGTTTYERQGETYDKIACQRESSFD